MKLRYALAALATIAVAIPSLASAETVIIKKHDRDHHWRGARAEYTVGPRFHRHFDRGERKVVIIKKSRHHHFD